MNRIAYWLLPTDQDKLLLFNLVTNLSKKYRTIPFEPHLTLNVIKSTKALTLSDLSKCVTTFHFPLTVPIEGVSFEHHFHKTLFLRLKNTDELQNLQSTIQTITRNSQYLFEPHVSLLYADISKQQKEIEAKKIIVGQNCIRFDKLAVVRVSKETKTQQDVANWKIIKKFKL